MREIRLRLLYLAAGFTICLIIGIMLYAFKFVSLQISEPLQKPEKAKVSQNKVIPGRWNEVVKPVNKEQYELELRRLRSLGYLAGSQPAPKKEGVTIYDRTRSFDSLNLVVSGHAPEASLMDMSGKILHTWKCDARRAWPEFKPGVDYKKHTFWRRAYLMPNGDLYAIFERTGLIKLDKNSRLIWGIRNNAHHDLDIDDNGNIYVLTGEAHINPKYNTQKPIWEDYISILDSRGQKLRRVSVLEALLNSDFASMLNRATPEGDILHTNTIELIKDPPNGRVTPFRKGTVLIAIRYLDAVCAVDLEKKTVYWAESNLWHWEHQPTLLGNGNVLVLDNKKTKNTSAVIEVEPISRRVKWSYVGGKDGEFYTGSCGSCQRLPNGNTLITESDSGRAFEVTPDKNIVWEYVNPHRAGAENELIATLFEIVRLRRNFPVGWLQ